MNYTERDLAWHEADISLHSWPNVPLYLWIPQNGNDQTHTHKHTRLHSCLPPPQSLTSKHLWHSCHFLYLPTLTSPVHTDHHPVWRSRPSSAEPCFPGCCLREMFLPIAVVTGGISVMKIIDAIFLFLRLAGKARELTEFTYAVRLWR